MEKPVSHPVPQKWFSIKEASEYLDIGEPTLYRWMREGRITFRKVGDSTRFWQEDLDAVMEVHHCAKDAAKALQVCPFCHCEELVEGLIQSTGRSYFRPRKTKFWTLKDANVETHARMCRRCGGIAWSGDLEKLNAIMEVEEKGETKSAEEKSST